jgi:hypothetical protein
MTDDPRDERPTDVEGTTPPPDYEMETDWREQIGPEDEDPEVIDENLEQYGFNQMDEDDFESDPVAPSDQPGWTEAATYGGERPLMPDEEVGAADMQEIEERDIDEE